MQREAHVHPSPTILSVSDMSSKARFLGRTVAVATLFVAAVISRPVHAGGGYFILGYGPLAGQSAGTSTAIGFDSFAGASNPAKLSMTDDRLDLGVILFNPIDGSRVPARRMPITTSRPPARTRSSSCPKQAIHTASMSASAGASRSTATAV
jgi:hypothetical protein